MITRVLPLACVLLLHLVPSALGPTIHSAEGYPAPASQRGSLLSNGTEPTALRYSVPPDYKAHMNMDLKMRNAMSVGDMHAARRFSSDHFGVDLTASRSPDDGDMEVSLTYGCEHRRARAPSVRSNSPPSTTICGPCRGTRFTVSNRGFLSRRPHQPRKQRVSDPQLRQVDGLDGQQQRCIGTGGARRRRKPMGTAHGDGSQRLPPVFQKMTVEAVAVDATSDNQTDHQTDRASSIS